MAAGELKTILEMLSVCVVLIGAALAPWLFSRYLYKNCNISAVFLLLFSFSLFLYILLRHPNLADHEMKSIYFVKDWREYLGLFPIIPYPIIFKKYLEKVKEGQGYKGYMVLLVLIHIVVFAYL